MLLKRAASSHWGMLESMLMAALYHPSLGTKYGLLGMLNKGLRCLNNNTHNTKSWIPTLPRACVDNKSVNSLVGQQHIMNRIRAADQSAALEGSVINQDEYIVSSDDLGGLTNGRYQCNQLQSEKLLVAVDIDEVLCSFLLALNTFIAERYALSHTVAEYHVYSFDKVWNCSLSEARSRVYEFYNSYHFRKGIHPIPGAYQVLLQLAPFCHFSIVTSRQNVIKQHTIEWVESHYSGLFKEIHFGNHFAVDGVARPKSEICQSLGAQILIDDNPLYALDCAENGIKVLLFDYQNSYPWCKTGNSCPHPLITKVQSWQEVQKHLAAYVLS